MAKYLSANTESDVYNELIKAETATSEEEMENLYNVETGEDKTGAELIEKAHPETVSVSDSYRENGGVVENLLEQQAYDIQCATRMPNTSVHRRACKKELINELRIIAGEMSIRENKDLVKFANSIINNISKKKLNKKAAFPFVPIGIAAAVVVPLVSAWWYLYHSSSSPVNTGISNNIYKTHIAINNYISQLRGIQSGEEGSGIDDKLLELNSIIESLAKSRNAYMERSKKLAIDLKQLSGISSNRKPEVKNINNVTNKNEKNALEMNNDAKIIVDEILRLNKKYSEYIKNSISPRLSSDLTYLTSYLKQTSDIDKVRDKDYGVLDKAKDLFSSDIEDEGEIIVKHLARLVESLKVDVSLRELDAKKTIDDISKPIEIDISKQFTEVK